MTCGSFAKSMSANGSLGICPVFFFSFFWFSSSSSIVISHFDFAIIGKVLVFRVKKKFFFFFDFIIMFWLGNSEFLLYGLCCCWNCLSDNAEFGF